MVKHILDTRQFKNREFLSAFYQRANEMEAAARKGTDNGRHAGKIVGSIFYQRSTRTRFLMEAAVKRLGAHVTSTEDAITFSSEAKGESFEHTFLAIEDGYDAFMVRHPDSGAPRRIADVLHKPVVNLGDGTNQHPVQALTDLYTIMHRFGRLDDLRIGFVGDIKHGRTVRSLAYLLAHLNDHRIYFVAPQELGLPDVMRDYLNSRETKFQETEDLDQVLKNVDILYVTRFQQEYEKDDDRVRQIMESCRKYQITPERADMMGERAVIMHPMPINRTKSDGYPEITPEVDKNSRAIYFRQSNNKLYVGMALLDGLLNGSQDPIYRGVIDHTAQ